MSVDNENATAISSPMNGMLLNSDVAIGAVNRADHLIVITRDVDDSCAFARFAQNFLDDVVVLLRPVTTAAHWPDVDLIGYYIEPFEIVFVQYILHSCR